MPDLPAITWPLKQKVTYWPLQTEEFDEFGQPVFESPIEINARWDEEIVEFLSPDGTKQMSKAVLFVDRFIRSGYLVNLPIASVSGTSPLKIGAWQVRGYEVTPDLSAAKALYTVYL
jgi:hypothetical protein